MRLGQRNSCQVAFIDWTRYLRMPESRSYSVALISLIKMGKTLKNYHQYVTRATSHTRTLDLCFGTVPSAYRSTAALPSLGTADHNSVPLAPM